MRRKKTENCDIHRKIYNFIRSAKEIYDAISGTILSSLNTPRESEDSGPEPKALSFYVFPSSFFMLKYLLGKTLL